MINYVPSFFSNFSNTIFSFVSPINQVTEPKEKVFCLLSDMDRSTDILIQEVFSRLTFTEFLTIGQVSKTLNNLTNEPAVLKQMIYQETFNPGDWKSHFGVDCLGANDAEKAWRSLPDNIGQIYKGQCQTFGPKNIFDTFSQLFKGPSPKFGETHVIVWIPEGISMNKYGEYLEQKFPENKNGYALSGRSDIKKIIDQFGDVKTEESHWVLMSKKVVQESILIHETKKLVNKLDLGDFESSTIPSLIKAIICISSTFFKSGAIIINRFHTSCQELVKYSNSQHFPIEVGFNIKDGIYFNSWIPFTVFDKPLFAECRRFTS